MATVRLAVKSICLALLCFALLQCLGRLRIHFIGAVVAHDATLINTQERHDVVLSKTNGRVPNKRSGSCLFASLSCKQQANPSSKPTTEILCKNHGDTNISINLL
jgi:hypothetical protein